MKVLLCELVSHLSDQILYLYFTLLRLIIGRSVHYPYIECHNGVFDAVDFRISSTLLLKMCQATQVSNKTLKLLNIEVLIVKKTIKSNIKINIEKLHFAQCLWKNPNHSVLLVN